MKATTRTAFWAGLILALVAIIVAGTIWSGVYNVAADTPHSRAVYTILDVARQRSISTRARALQIPEGLSSEDRVRQGSGNYDAMCVACHLAPGISQTELSLGLYPTPPNLTATTVDPAEAFWVIKHGIKASGMPAWGLSMDDEYIWNMVAFLQQLPQLDAPAYRTLVASSGGHSHGGGETNPHGDEHDDHHHDNDHHDDKSEGIDHHDRESSQPKAAPSDDHADHDHTH